MYYYELTITDKLLKQESSYQSEVKRPFFKGIVSNDIHEAIQCIMRTGTQECKIETTTLIYDIHQIK